MCFLKHKVPGQADSQIPASTNPFDSGSIGDNPFGANPFGGGDTGGFKEFTPSKEFVPNNQFVPSKEFIPKSEQPESSQSGILAMMKQLGYEAEVDHENNTVFIKKFEDCSCCHGLINSCDGDFCENLGLCHCISAAIHQDSDSDE